MKHRGHAILGVLFLLAVAGSHLGKSRLDSIRPHEGFRELLYLPRGRALDVMSFGFKAPVADMLFLKGALYFSDNLRAKQLRHDSAARYRYVFRLHELITDIAPRHERAYLNGAIYLFSTGRERDTLKGIELLEKGIDVMEQAEADGVPLTPDPRWRFYLLIGNAYDQQLGDMSTAIGYFEKAVERPECPPSVYHAYAGFRQQLQVGGGALQRHDTMIAVWSGLLKSMEERGSDPTVMNPIRERLESLRQRRARIDVTLQSEKILTEAYRTFQTQHNRLPRGLQEVLDRGVLSAPPPMPFHKNNDFGNSPDWWMVLPDGEVKSYILARIEASFTTLRLFDLVDRFYHSHDQHFPGNYEVLVQAGLLGEVPTHPLAALGYRFTFDPRNGSIGIFDPEFGRNMRMDYTDVPGHHPKPDEAEAD